MEDPKQCPECGHNAVRVKRVNPNGRELGSFAIWLFFGLSIVIFFASFFGLYGPYANRLLTAIPGIILVLIATFFLFLFSKMPKRYRCDNAHTWDWPQ